MIFVFLVFEKEEVVDFVEQDFGVKEEEQCDEDDGVLVLCWMGFFR